MQKDTKHTNILIEIQRMFLAEFGEELSIEEIAIAVDAQGEFVVDRMRAREGVRLPKLGKVITHEMKRAKRTAEKQNKAIIRGEINKTIADGSGIGNIRKLSNLQAISA